MIGPLIGYGYQGLALEVNPWLTREVVDATNLLRGAIIGGWANVESSLIELSIRASHALEYVGHRELYPKKLSSRVSYLAQVSISPAH